MFDIHIILTTISFPLLLPPRQARELNSTRETRLLPLAERSAAAILAIKITMVDIHPAYCLFVAVVAGGDDTIWTRTSTFPLLHYFMTHGST